MTAMNMVKAGMGVTFVPKQSFPYMVRMKDSAFLDLMNRRSNGEVGIAYKNGLPLKRQARLLVECMKELL